MGLLVIPLADKWEEQSYMTQIVPIWSQSGYNDWLFFHLNLAGFSVFGVGYPAVPKGHSR